MVQEGQTAIQRSLRGGAPAATTATARGVANTAINWSAGLMWSWFGTWLVAAILAVLGGVISVGQLRPRVRARPIETPSVSSSHVEQPA